MNSELVPSLHAFRVRADQAPPKFPRRAPANSYFYLVTPNPHAAKKKYLHSVVTENKSGSKRIVLTHSVGIAKPFTHLEVAEAFAAFLADPEIVQHDHDFWVTLEGPGYQAAPLNRAEITSLAGA